MQNEIRSSAQKLSFCDVVFGTHDVTTWQNFCILRIDQGPGYGCMGGSKRDYESTGKRKYPNRGAIMLAGTRFISGTLCSVPYVRGRERSREPEEIVREMPGAGTDDVTEIMLLRQNANSYGKGLPQEITFADLLRRKRESGCR